MLIQMRMSSESCMRMSIFSYHMCIKSIFLTCGLNFSWQRTETPHEIRLWRFPCVLSELKQFNISLETSKLVTLNRSRVGISSVRWSPLSLVARQQCLNFQQIFFRFLVHKARRRNRAIPLCRGYLAFMDFGGVRTARKGSADRVFMFRVKLHQQKVIAESPFTTAF